MGGGAACDAGDPEPDLRGPWPTATFCGDKKKITHSKVAAINYQK